MLLRHSLADDAGAGRIESAVEQTFASGARTSDLARSGEPALSTAEFTERVLSFC